MKRPNSLWVFEGLFYTSIVWQIIFAYPDAGTRLAATVQGGINAILVILIIYAKSHIARALLVLFFLFAFFGDLHFQFLRKQEKRAAGS